MHQDNTNHHRPIRSYVRREGRITPAQRRALGELWPRFGLDAGVPTDIEQVFGRIAPIIAEIGFGDGSALLQMAQKHPANDYIGIDVHRPGVGRLLLQLDKQKYENVRVFCEDAKQVFAHCLPPSSLDTVLIFFPDPWHKKRHHKRRLIHADFVTLVVDTLKPAGRLHIATDCHDYAEHIMHVLSNEPWLTNCAGEWKYARRPNYRPFTKYECRGQILGHSVWDLVFKKIQREIPV